MSRNGSETLRRAPEWLQLPVPTAAADHGVPPVFHPDNPHRERARWMAMSIALNTAAGRVPDVHREHPLEEDATIYDGKIDKLLGDQQPGALDGAVDVLEKHITAVREASDEGLDYALARGPAVSAQVIDLLTGKQR